MDPAFLAAKNRLSSTSIGQRNWLAMRGRSGGFFGRSLLIGRRFGLVGWSLLTAFLLCLFACEMPWKMFGKCFLVE